MTRWIASCVAAFAVNLAAIAAAAAQPSAQPDTLPGPDADLIEVGKRIYRDGILPSGQPLVGVVQAGVQRAGTDAACATCHRRSGYGSSEGSIEVRPITGPALFSRNEPRPVTMPPEAIGNRLRAANPGNGAAASSDLLYQSRIAAFYGSRQRPPYDAPTLARAVRDGTDVTGHPMNPGMPRFKLDDEAFRALSAYLATLSSQLSPGVTEDEIHFATVIQPGVAAETRRAVVALLQAYFDDRNAGMRAERNRERAGSVRLGRTFRAWVLHVWELSGSSTGWQHQLEALYAQRSVFALVGGLGDSGWQPIHAFSERFEVPCILPDTILPAVDAPDVYTVYPSRGIVLEAEALARHLQSRPVQAIVTQVFRHDDEAAQTAADAFRAAWSAATGQAPGERALDGRPGADFWRSLADSAPGAIFVLWLRPQDTAEAQTLLQAAANVGEIYLSDSLQGPTEAVLFAGGHGRVHVVSTLDAPAARAQRLASAKKWLADRGIALVDDQAQMAAFLAVTVVARAMSHAMDTLSRDFMIERIEHSLGLAFDASPYPRLSLGPGQRFASKGAYILRVPDTGAPLQLVSGWIVP